MFPSKVEQNNLKATIAASYNKLYGQFSSKELSEVGNYKILKLIGEGSFGKVYLACHRLTHIKVVLKMGSKNDPNVVREVFYHRQFDYSYITKLYEVIVTENYVWMALEYCPGKELYEYLLTKKHIPLDECARLFSQVVGAVFYAHSLQCVHRDLKLENILLDKKGQAKLTDFGFTRECATKSLLETICGTTVYMAPELIERKCYDGFKIDTWSLGVILYTMIHGTMPFDEDDETKTKWKIVNDNPTYNESLISSDAKDLVEKLLQKDPIQRPSLNEVLLHPFLQPNGGMILERTEKIIKRQRQGPKNFHGKLERRLLKRLKQVGFDSQAIKHSVNKRKCDSLSGMWLLLLERERRIEYSKYPKRSRSVLSVRKVFESTPPLKQQDDNLLEFNEPCATSSVKRILSRKSDTASIHQPINKPSRKSSLRHASSNNEQDSLSGRQKKNNIFMKMTNFFKNKKQSTYRDNPSVTNTPLNIRANDKRKRKTNSSESRRISPKVSPKKPERNNSLKREDARSSSTPVKSEVLTIEEPVLKKFKSTTSSEISHQTSLGNYDSEFDNRTTISARQTAPDGQKFSPAQKGRPLSMLSQHSEISNDTYNSEYSTDGNQSNSKPSSVGNITTRQTNSVSISAHSTNTDGPSVYSRGGARRSMSIMSSASSASERSSRTDSFYDISTASSPKTMDIRALNGNMVADTVAPRIAVGSSWLAKRGRSPITRRGRLPKRNISRKLLNRNSSATQSVIQEESSFEDEEEPPEVLRPSEEFPNTDDPNLTGEEDNLKSESGTASKASTPANPAILSEVNRPGILNMARSFSGGSGWSHNYAAEHAHSSEMLPSQNTDEHLEVGFADDEDNSLEDEQENEKNETI